MNRFPMSPYPAGWFRVADSAELARGGVKPLRFFGQDLVAFRGESGSSHVMSAFCPHLGAHLGHGKVVGETVQCPWHGWRIDDGGNCAYIPDCAQIPAHEPVKVWPSVESNGSLMVYHDPSGQDPAWMVPGLPEFASSDWTNFTIGNSWRVRGHVQDLSENGIDAAHFSFLHSQHTRGIHVLDCQPDGPVLRYRATHHYNVPRIAELVSGKIEGPFDIDYFGIGMLVNRVQVPPATARYAVLSYFTPIDEEFSEFTLKYAMTKSRVPFANRILLNKARKEGQVAVAQDTLIWETKTYRENPNVSDADGPIPQYRDWSRQFYSSSPSPAESAPLGC